MTLRALRVLGPSLLGAAVLCGMILVDDEQEQPAVDVPAAVQQALAVHLQGATLESLTREVEDGVVLYEGTWSVDGREHEVTLAADGTLVEDSTEIPEGDAPAAVRAAAHQRLGDGPLKFERKLVVMFEATDEGPGGSDEREVLVKATGALARADHEAREAEREDGREDEADDGEEQEIALDAVPAAVLQAALAALPGARFEEAEVEQEDGRTVYSLEGTQGGEAVEIELSADGQVLEVERGDEDD